MIRQSRLGTGSQSPTASRSSLASCTVLLASPYYPPAVGGVEQYVWHLARELTTRHGVRVVIATTSLSPNVSRPARGVDGITVYELPTWGKISNTPIGARWRHQLRRIIEQENVDLVNAHAPVPLFADATARACVGAPFVLTYHTGRMRKRRLLADVTCAAYEHTILARTANRAQEIIRASDFVASDLPHLFAGTSTTIYPGVDLGLFRSTPLPESPRILFVGSLERAAPDKGLPDLLRAMRRLVSTTPDIQLEVVGSGSQAPEYEEESRALGLTHHVTFSGRLAGEDLAAAFRRTRVFALPTHDDSLPTVLVEAMASGRPVVTTRVGGIPELVKDGGNGLLIVPGDVRGLAAGIGSVLSDDDLAQRLSTAGLRSANGVSWERQGECTVEVFSRAMGATQERVRTMAVVVPHYPPTVGGVGHYASRTSHAVNEDGKLRSVVTASNPHSRRTAVTVDGKSIVVRLGSRLRIFDAPLSPQWPLELSGWLRRFRVELINAHLPVPGLADIAGSVSGRRPLVMTHHTRFTQKGTGRYKFAAQLYERFRLPRVLARADVLVTLLPASLAARRGRAIQITPGVDLDQFLPGPPPSQRPPWIVCVVSLDWSSSRTDVDVLLRAFAELTDIPDARLRLVGSGSAFAHQRALSQELGLADRVELTGQLLGPELVSALQSAAVLVLPSRGEPGSFEVGLIEAMGCGTPVVGSDVGGIPHVLIHHRNGLLVPPGDVNALASACRTILEDGCLADRLGKAGRQDAAIHNALPPLTRSYVGKFRDLMEKTTGSLPRSSRSSPGIDP